MSIVMIKLDDKGYRLLKSEPTASAMGPRSVRTHWHVANRRWQTRSVPFYPSVEDAMAGSGLKDGQFTIQIVDNSSRIALEY